MNLLLKVFCIVFLCISILCAANCSAEPLKGQDKPTSLCEQAKNGTLNISQIDISNAHSNAYLYDCSVAVVISDPIKVSGESGSKAERDLKKINRTKIADYLLANELDVNFKNQYGNNMLIATVISFLPIEWKEKAVERLIAQGINIEEKNNGGKTALDLAK